MAERMTNTLVEFRQRVMKDLGQLKLDASLSPDELAEVFELEAFLMEKARQPIAAMEQQGLLPPGGAPIGAGMSPMGAPGAVPGVASGVSVDEMARMLQQPQSNF